MEGFLLGRAFAEARLTAVEDVLLHDASRQIWVVPIRHHSPACAAQLERLIAAVKPSAIVVEGPCDFDPLIELLCDPRTRAPVAVVALREAEAGQAAPRGARRVASYFPLCAHSPELIALQAAAADRLPVRFMDLPSTSREMLFDEIDAALEELPEEQRSVFIAHEMEGYSFKELAAQTGVSINTLISRKRYAVLHLRERLQTIHDEFLKQ